MERSGGSLAHSFLVRGEKRRRELRGVWIRMERRLELGMHGARDEAHELEPLPRHAEPRGHGRRLARRTWRRELRAERAHKLDVQQLQARGEKLLRRLPRR